MSRLLYVSVWDFSREEENGICKKIKSQEKVFIDAGFQVDRTFIRNGQACMRINGEEIRLGSVGILGKVEANRLFYKYLKKHLLENTYEAVYIRYGLSDRGFFQICRLLKKQGSRIILEIPTYPYEGEAIRGLKDKVGIFLDHTYRAKLSPYVDFIATFTEDREIWKIPAYRIENGIDVDTIRPRKGCHGFDRLNLVAVANVGPWHGYDRLIEAMGRYYERGGDKPCTFHLAGGGAELEKYRQLVAKWKLEDHVVFHGSVYGQALDDLYEEMDLAVETLGMHRKGIALSSSLKSKEYALKGLPILTSCKLDAFPEETCSFVCMLPSGESEIDLQQILQFYENLYRDPDTGAWDLDKKKALSEEIATYARKRCDMHVTMADTVQRLKRVQQ